MKLNIAKIYYIDNTMAKRKKDKRTNKDLQNNT
jgi:hypothetical protein